MPTEEGQLTKAEDVILKTIAAQFPASVVVNAIIDALFNEGRWEDANEGSKVRRFKEDQLVAMQVLRDTAIKLVALEARSGSKG